jgi:transcriptional regulator with XRE-family HTH domain
MSTASQTTTKNLSVLVTRPGAEATIPEWIRGYSPEKATGSRVQALTRLPDVTVVQANGPRAVLKRQDFLRSLAGKQAKTPGLAKILFVFRASTRAPDAERLSDLLRFFSRPSDVEFASGSSQAAFAFQEAVAKLTVSRLRESPETGEADPLGRLASVLAATSDLRTGSGRLSARKVADRFGLSVAELASLLGTSRQAASKTEDAESLQEGLAPFARIARLRAVLADEDFRAWLNMANDSLVGRPPLALIRDGRSDIVADLAEDMLSGSPG